MIAMKVAPYVVAMLLSIGVAAAQQASVANDDAYLVQADVLIETPEGGMLSVVVARRPEANRQPTALNFTIYTNLEAHRQWALRAAQRGYVGIVVDARGKRLSSGPIVPYEHEVQDVYAAIDWVSKQPWSDGQVAVYGGSYGGFTSWAALKKGVHPALKTIVAWAAAIPGQGLPMENNIFVNANYAWAFYVANNKFLDEETYNQTGRWNALNARWFASGRPYREIDAVDGTPNPHLQRWLKHPSFDAYWQAMVPYGEDFARIDIPVLSITGYYDDGQISALQYVKEHYRHRPNANHYLVIGPYDHFGAQAAVKPEMLRGYAIDAVAQFDTRDITFDWLDYVMKGGPKPELLQDKVTYQVMGANEWRHASSLEAMSNDTLKLYLSATRTGDHYTLSAEEGDGFLSQTVDFGNRATFSYGYYPAQIVRPAFPVTNALSFVSEPFAEPVSINGTFTAVLTASINKRDFDFEVVLYELTSSGAVMHLSYCIQRASYAEDPTVRTLLQPSEWASIPCERSRMVSRELGAGSRLLVVIDVIKDGFHQVNYGTGGDVSDESIEDAGTPLEVKWRSDSFVQLPLWRGSIQQ